jgi:hypothetical protein
MSDAKADLDRARKAVKPTPPPGWKAQLNRIALSAAPNKTEEPPWPSGTEIVYLVDVAKSKATGKVVLTIGRREPSKTPRPYLIDGNRIAKVPLAEDREMLAMLLGAGAHDPFGYSPANDRGSNTFSLSAVIAQTLLPRIVRNGRGIVVLHGSGGAGSYWMDRFAPTLMKFGVGAYAPHYLQKTRSQRATAEMILDGKHFPDSTGREPAITHATAISGSRASRFRSWLRNSKAARSRSIHKRSSNRACKENRYPVAGSFPLLLLT